MSIKKGIYKYDTGEKDENGNEIFNEIYFKTLGSLVEEDATRRFVTDAEKVIWNEKANNIAATQVANGLMSAIDKKKLDGIQAGANAYVHPSTHEAAMIAQDASHRFVTDADKTNWNSKANNTAVTQVANGLMSAVDKTKLDGIQAGANAYVHPSNHAANMITEDVNHRFVSDAEKATYALGGITNQHNANDSGETVWWRRYPDGRLECGGLSALNTGLTNFIDFQITFPVKFFGDRDSIHLSLDGCVPKARNDDWKDIHDGFSYPVSTANGRILVFGLNPNYQLSIWWTARGWWK